MRGLALFLTLFSTSAFADCIDMGRISGFEMLNRSTMLVKARGRPYAVIKLFGYVLPGSNVRILKDDYVCSYEDDVFFSDGDVIDVMRIQKID